MSLRISSSDIALGARQRGVVLSGGGGVASLLPFTDDFNRANGAIGNGWEGSGSTWTISGNTAVNTPTLGAELLVNGGFDADTDWTKGTGWTIAAGIATKAAGSTSNLTQATGAAGGWYRVVWTLVRRAGGFAARFGGVNGPGRSASATYTDSNRSTSTLLGIAATSGASDGDVDNVSAKQLTVAELFRSRDFGRADVDVSIEGTIVTGSCIGVVLNLDSVLSPANFVYACHDGVVAQLTKCVAGTYTQLISASATYSAGAAIRVTKSGTTYKLYYNGVQVGTDQTVSDAGIISNTRHGFESTYELCSVDDFSILAV